MAIHGPLDRERFFFVSERFGGASAREDPRASVPWTAIGKEDLSSF